MLNDKVAVVYGAGGAIGGAVARAFASEGAIVFLTGRRLASVQGVAKEIAAAGGSAAAAEVDALSEQAVHEHLQSVLDTTGHVDISFNAVGVADERILGVAPLELEADKFTLPIEAYTKSYFLTAQVAARHMVPNKTGVIMTVSAPPSRQGTRSNGGYGPAMAAKEALTRDLSAEFAPSGVRVVCLRPHGMTETKTMKRVFDLKLSQSMSWEQFEAFLANSTHPRRIMRLEEVANVAAFAASDKASGLTGTTLNLTMGSMDD